MSANPSPPREHEIFNRLARSLPFGFMIGIGLVASIGVLRGSRPVLFLIPGLVVVVGVLGLISVWRKRRPGTISVPQGSRRGIAGLRFLALMFVVLGGAFLVLWYLPMLKTSLSSMKWSETPCLILTSGVREHSGRNGTTYSVDISYRYTVEGREYESRRYSSFGGSSSGRAGKQSVVAQYPVGSQRVCFVNPENPSEALLKPGLGWETLLGLFPLLFMGIGVLLLAGSFRKTGFQRAPCGIGEAPPEQGNLPCAGDLKGETSPRSRFVSILVTALIWNGIVAVFIWKAMEDTPDAGLVFFLGIFAVAGLGLLVAAGYFALALLNPRCHVQLISSGLAPGAEYAISWSFSGATRRLERLRMVWEGREQVAYRSGKSNKSKRVVFARFLVVDMTDPLEMIQGAAHGRLPEGIPPSFEAPDNKLIWVLRVHGAISRWPDVDESYPVTVSPKLRQ